MFLSGSNSQPLFKTIRSFALADFGGLKSGCWGNFGKHFDIIKVKEFKRSCKVKNFWDKSFTELIGVVKYTVRPFMVPMFDHHVYKTECFRTGFIRSKIRMFFVFIAEFSKMGSKQAVIPGMRICAAEDHYQSGTKSFSTSKEAFRCVFCAFGAGPWLYSRFSWLTQIFNSFWPNSNGVLWDH